MAAWSAAGVARRERRGEADERGVRGYVWELGIGWGGKGECEVGVNPPSHGLGSLRMNEMNSMAGMVW